MCSRCDKAVIEMDIRESDLPYLPYTNHKWLCWVPGCKCGANVRNYGIAPFYWHPVKIKRYDNGKWRGGWFELTGHWYLCSRHWPELKHIGQHAFIDKYNLRELDTEEYRLSRIIEHKPNKYGRR